MAAMAPEQDSDLEHFSTTAIYIVSYYCAIYNLYRFRAMHEMVLAVKLKPTGEMGHDNK